MANPTVFRWQAPSKNEDGTAIDYTIDYELGEDEGDGIDGNYVPKVALAGSLTAGGFYEAPVGQMAWSPGTHTVALRAINHAEPTKVSAWSNAAVFLWSDRIPMPPLAFTVA